MKSDEGMEALVQARLLLDAFIAKHHAVAIPAMLAACVSWSVEHGAGDLIRSSLSMATKTSIAAEEAWREHLS